MKFLWLLFFYSSAAFSLSYVENIDLIPPSEFWYTGDVEAIAEPLIEDYQAANVSYQDLRPLIERIESSSFHQLIPEALKRYQVSQKEDLVQLIQACKFKDKKVQGLFIAQESYNIRSKTFGIDTEEAFLKSLKVDKAPKIYVVRDMPIAPQIFASFAYVSGNMKICIRPEISIAKATSVLVHELIHFTRGDLLLGTVSPLTENEEFINDLLESKGGEKEAYSEEVRFLMESELTMSGKEKIIKDWAHSIDSSGNIINHKIFNSKILNARNYKKKFTENRKDYYTIELKYFEFMEKKLEILIQNLDIKFKYRESLEEHISHLSEVNKQNEKHLRILRKNIEIIKNNLSLNISDEDRQNQEQFLKQTQQELIRDEAIHQQYQTQLIEVRKSLQETEVRIKKYKKIVTDKNTLLNVLDAVQLHLNSLKNTKI